MLRRRQVVTRAGFTLVESMIASALLAVSVLGVSGTILSSYAHDKQSIATRDAVNAAEAMMDEVTALPFTAGSATSVGMMDFASYSDTSTSGSANVASANVAASRGTTPTSSSASSGSSGGLVGGLLGLVGGLLGGGSSSGSSGSGATTPTPLTPYTTSMTPTTASRVVSITRQESINGAATATGKLAIVTIDASIGSGQTVRLRRLVTSTEAESSTTIEGAGQ